MIDAPAAPASDAGSDAALRDALVGCTFSDAALDELQVYCRNLFETGRDCAGHAQIPLPDEPFVGAWEEYVGESAEVGAWTCLRRRLVQLRFPVAAGISQTPEYLAAIRRGVHPPEGPGLTLRDPLGVRIWLHPTAAGRIPVVVATERSDFVALVQALTRKNEPETVPDSMGACIVGGYNNWDRVARLREQWRAESPEGTEKEWQLRFRSIIPVKELYQDRFILLSAGPYSAVPAAALGLDAEAWDAFSLTIRLEHECAHYVTRRVFGSMRNSFHDELIADYVGIRAAIGHFRRDWFLRFMGLESYPEFRPGGRLEAYRGAPPLSDPAFRLLQAIVVRAADQLQQLDDRFAASNDPAFLVRVLDALAGESLPALASPDAATRIHRQLTGAPPGWADLTPAGAAPGHTAAASGTSGTSPPSGRSAPAGSPELTIAGRGGETRQTHSEPGFGVDSAPQVA